MINYNKLYELGKLKRDKLINKSWKDIAIECGLIGPTAGEKARCIVKRNRNNNRHNNQIQLDIDSYNSDYYNDNNESVTVMHDYKEETLINNDGSISDNRLIELSQEEKINPTFLIQKHGFDPNLFELVSARNVMWNVQTKNDSTKTLYSSRIVVKPVKNAISFDKIKESFNNLINELKNKDEILSKDYSEMYSKNANADRMLEVNITDLHLGKLAYDSVTGNICNSGKTKKNFFSVIYQLLEKFKNNPFEKILFVFSNDFFNYDTINGTTTAGTQQDNDLQWQDLFKLGCEMLVEAIELLSGIAPVKVFYIGSNHDKQSSYYAICYLSAWFKNSTVVEVDDSPVSRKIEKYGNNLICFLHGDMNKKQLTGLLPREYPVEWGQTKFHEIHAGHLHSEQQTTEESGCIIRYLSSITNTDRWHYESGYTGSVLKCQHFVWHKFYGLEEIINTPIIDII